MGEVMIPIDSIIQGDCLEVMKGIEDKSIDMILCDLPYGMLEFEWDCPLPLDKLWKQYKRIIKDRSAIVLTGSQPFTSELVMSNKTWFRHEWIWVKSPTNFCAFKNNPAREHENIVIFGNKPVKFNPIGQPQSASSQIRAKYPKVGPGSLNKENREGKSEYLTKLMKNRVRIYDSEKLRHPASVQIFSRGNGYASVNKESEMKHPTQKPVALFEYLINTYTNESDLVLDNCIGSGTTAVACIKTNRHYIGIELSQEYCDISNKRIDAENAQLNLDFSMAGG